MLNKKIHTALYHWTNQFRYTFAKPTPFIQFGQCKKEHKKPSLHIQIKHARSFPNSFIFLQQNFWLISIITITHDKPNFSFLIFSKHQLHRCILNVYVCLVLNEVMLGGCTCYKWVWFADFVLINIVNDNGYLKLVNKVLVERLLMCYACMCI